MLKRSLGVFLIPMIGWAQYSGLAANADGSRVLFSTIFRQPDNGQSQALKLFSADEQSLRLVLQRDPVWTQGPNVTTSNPYLIYSPAISSDGSVVAFAAGTGCMGLSGCIGNTYSTSELLLNGQTNVIDYGQPHLSRNGLYLAASVTSGLERFPEGTSWHDLASGAKTSLPAGLIRGRRVVTDAGDVLYSYSPSGDLALWRASKPDSPSVIARASNSATAEVDAAGRTAVYIGYVAGAAGNAAGSWTLWAVDVESGLQTPIAQIPQSFSQTQLSLSDDGRTVLFVAPAASNGSTGSVPQVFVSRTDGTGLRQLTKRPEGIQDAVLSGNGQVAYAATLAGGLLKIDVSTGAMKTIVDRVPYVSTSVRISPGSLIESPGYGFIEPREVATGNTPLPYSLAGLRVFVGGQQVPILYVTSTTVGWQQPWENPRGDLEVRRDGALLEQGPVGFQCCFDAAPSARVLPQPGQPSYSWPIQAAHERFESTVSSDNPARPGEVVHFYLTGLGPVEPPVATGYPSPSNPPAVVLAPVHCLIEENEAEVVFSGLAPGFVGVYQVDVRLPQELPNGNTRVTFFLAERYPQASGVLPTASAGLAKLDLKRTQK